MNKKIQDMTREELQEFLDSFSRSVQGITQGYLDKVDALRANGKEGSLLGGETNKKSGWASKVGKQWGKVNMIEHMNKEIQCQHCGESTNLGNIEKYHKYGSCKQRNELEKRMVELYENGMSIPMLTKEFNLTEAAIFRILKINDANIRKNQVLTEEDVWNILLQLENKVNRKELVKLYGVSKPTIDHIAQGRSWNTVQEKYKEYKSQIK